MPLLNSDKKRKELSSDNSERAVERVNEAWSKLEKWLEKNRPNAFKSLKDGATDTDLDELEKEIGGFKLPTDYRAFMRRHNGQSLDEMKVIEDGLFEDAQFLGLDEQYSHVQDSNLSEFAKSLKTDHNKDAKKPRSGAGKGKGGRGLGLASQLPQSHNFAGFVVFSSTEPMGAEEDSKGHLLALEPDNISCVCPFSFQFMSMEECWQNREFNDLRPTVHGFADWFESFVNLKTSKSS